MACRKATNKDRELIEAAINFNQAMSEKYDNTNKGAVWKGKTKDGATYYSLKLNIDGKDLQLKFFTNDRKNDNQPIFNVIVEPPEKKDEPKLPF